MTISIRFDSIITVLDNSKITNKQTQHIEYKENRKKYLKNLYKNKYK
jgi:hypothetical protein